MLNKKSRNILSKLTLTFFTCSDSRFEHIKMLKTKGGTEMNTNMDCDLELFDDPFIGN